MLNKKLYGLIGFPLSHSFSKKYFTAKFEKENISDCNYELFPIDSIDNLPQLIKDNPDLKGLNVTIPYKESVIPFLDELDETARAVGAVNCIKIDSSSKYQVASSRYQVSSSKYQDIIENNNDFKLIGYNTDVFGFKQSIKPFLESHHERALILGTGGASKAVAYVLNEIGIDCYFVTRHKTPLLFKEGLGEVTNNKLFNYSELNEAVCNSFKLIINTTPIGMFPNINKSPEIPYQFINTSHLLYDLIYNPIETAFLKKGKEKGAKTINGLTMLQQQAEESWKIWNC